jgi:hypothetical protein
MRDQDSLAPSDTILLRKTRGLPAWFLSFILHNSEQRARSLHRVCRRCYPRSVATTICLERRRLVSLAAGISKPLSETRDACPLPQFTEIFFHKNVTDVFTPAPTKRLHYQLRPSLDMSIKHRSRAKNELHASRSLAPSGQGKSVRFLPDAIHLSGSSSSASDVDVIGIASTGAA